MSSDGSWFINHRNTKVKSRFFSKSLAYNWDRNIKWTEGIKHLEFSIIILSKELLKIPTPLFIGRLRPA